MKKRVRKIANFFAFNLLFFALYLNFIHKDKPTIQDNNQDDNISVQPKAATAFGATVLVVNPEKYLLEKN